MAEEVDHEVDGLGWLVNKKLLNHVFKKFVYLVFLKVGFDARSVFKF